MASPSSTLVPQDRVLRAIVVIRGQKSKCKVAFDAIRRLMTPSRGKAKQIGFRLARKK